VVAIEVQEICPNCGDSVDQLTDSTGWCKECTAPYCTKCGKELHDSKKLCGTCRHIQFLEQNADTLEIFTAQGYSLEQAKHKVSELNRPRCICCNEPIYHAKQGAYFCTRSSECRSAKRRYRTLRERYPTDLALQLVQQEILQRSNTGGNDGSGTRTHSKENQ
jgi:hypothetical protein